MSENQLRRLLLTSQNMLESARKGAWDGLAQQAAQHFQELQSVLSTPGLERSEEMAALVTELLDLNRELMQGAVVQKGELGSELDELRRGEAAKRGYGKYKR